MPPALPLPKLNRSWIERRSLIVVNLSCASGRELLERLRSELRHFQETRPGRLHDEQLAEALDLVNSWLAELTGQLRQPVATAQQALTNLVREFGISETELGRDLIAFEDAAARFRRSQPAKY